MHLVPGSMEGKGVMQEVISVFTEDSTSYRGSSVMQHLNPCPYGSKPEEIPKYYGHDGVMEHFLKQGWSLVAVVPYDKNDSCLITYMTREWVDKD